MNILAYQKCSYCYVTAEYQYRIVVKTEKGAEVLSLNSQNDLTKTLLKNEMCIEDTNEFVKALFQEEENKTFELSFLWNVMTDGKFPADKLKEVDNDCEIIIENTERVTEKKVTIKAVIDSSDNPLEVAFQIGRLVQSLKKY